MRRVALPLQAALRCKRHLFTQCEPTFVCAAAGPDLHWPACCRYRAHVHARQPQEILLPPARLIFLRPLADKPKGRPATPESGPVTPSGRLARDKSQCHQSTQQRPVSPNTQQRQQQLQQGSDVQPDSDPAGRGIAEGASSGLDGLANGIALEGRGVSKEAAAQDLLEAGGQGAAGQAAGQGEQWDAVWLQPKQLLDEGLLLSTQWRRHHSGPAIIAALSAALASCST